MIKILSNKLSLLITILLLLGQSYTLYGQIFIRRTANNCDGSSFTYNEVTSRTGRIWMDRNLGASQVATNSVDAASYGDLYQWGRLKDGHQCRNSGVQNGLSATDVPGHANFISPQNIFHWRNNNNANYFWQGVNGINNPCPTGFRIPSQNEWRLERQSWIGGNNAAGAFNSVLKLTLGGRRIDNASFSVVGISGYYQSSTVEWAFQTRFRVITLFIDAGNLNDNDKSNNIPAATSVRCIKN